MRVTMFLAATLAVAGPALAVPQSSLGGLGSMLGGGLPDVGKVGVSNAAGVIGYCVKNNYLTGANATSVLGKLTGQKGVTEQPGFDAGQSGLLQAGGSSFSLDSLKGQVKTKLCDMVLKRGTSFLGGGLGK